MTPLFKQLFEQTRINTTKITLVGPERVLAGYGFSVNLGAYLLLDKRSVTPTHRQKIAIQGKKISLKQAAELHCTGRYNLATHTPHPCPDQVVLSPKSPSTSCKACYTHTGFYPAFDTIAQEKLSNQQQIYNQALHHVYLAYFAPGVIKVGMAHHKRYYSRFLEQGARAGCRVHTFRDAYQARAFEKKAVSIGLKERLSRKKKIALLSKFPYSTAQGERSLRNALQHLHKRTDAPINLANTIEDFQEVYFPDGQPSLLTPHYLQAYILEGKVHGMVGSILVLQKGNQHLLLDIKPWLGRLFIYV